MDVRDGRAVPPGLGSGLFPVWQEFSIHIGLPPNPMVLEILTGHKLSIQIQTSIKSDGEQVFKTPN